MKRLLSLLALVLIMAALFPLSLASAQTCSDCWFFTPTPTPTGSATPTPGAGTPTVVAPPSTVEFPQIEFEVPTPIPTVDFPNVSGPIQVTFPAPPSNISMPTISTPNSLSITNFSPFTIPTPSSLSITNITFPSPFSPSVFITDTSVITITPLTFTLNITHDPLLTVSVSISDSQILTGSIDLISSTQGVISDVISLTTAITEDYLSIQATDTITIISAPAEYAPDMPRAIADVGYTFEQLAPGVDTGQRFTVASWGGFLGYIVSLPFQLIKSLWALADRLGPFFLFLAWLLIMAGLIFIVEIIRFLWHVLWTVVDLIVKAIDVIGDWIPFT